LHNPATPTYKRETFRSNVEGFFVYHDFID